jgi:hypothetical protein
MGTSIVSEGQQLDGNAAAGLLSEVFSRDLTAARATCAGCGLTSTIGVLHLYAQAMGAILRCPGCESVVLRLSRTTTHVWIDATGSRVIVVPFSEAPRESPA